MPLRRKPRIKMVAPVRLWGMDSTGKSFNVLSYTLNVSSSGARIGGVKVPLAVGDAVTVQYKQNKALFKVVWLGRPGDPTHEQIGVTILEQDRPIWGEIEDPPNFRDDFQGIRSEGPKLTAPAEQRPPEPTPATTQNVPAGTQPLTIPDVLPTAPADDAPDVDTNELLRRCAEGLLKIDDFVKKRPPESARLQEFRDALAKVRQTVWALQQWHEVKAEGTKAFPLLTYLNMERVRFITHATKDLADDMEQKGVEVDRESLQGLFKNMDRLREIGSRLFQLEVSLTDEKEPSAESPAAKMRVALGSLMTDSLRAGMSESDTMQLLARELRRTIHADGVAVAWLENGEMVCVGSSGNAPETGMVLETEAGIGGEAARTRNVVYCADAQHDARVDAELCRTANIGAVAMVPVVSKTQAPIGFLQVSTARTNPFGGEHLEALRTAADLLRDAMAARVVADTQET